MRCRGFKAIFFNFSNHEFGLVLCQSVLLLHKHYLNGLKDVKNQFLTYTSLSPETAMKSLCAFGEAQKFLRPKFFSLYILLFYYLINVFVDRMEKILGDLVFWDFMF